MSRAYTGFNGRSPSKHQYFVVLWTADPRYGSFLPSYYARLGSAFSL
jgi:hypothetical protein